MQTRHSQALTFFLLLAALMVLGACQQRAPRVQTDPTPVQPAPEPQPVPQPKPQPEPKTKPVPPADPLRLTVLVSADDPEYTSIADALVGFAGAERITRIDLAGRPDRAREALARLREDQPESVVAIGLLAALTANELEESRVVFCQVLNYVDHDLLNEHTRGISAFPCLQEVVRTWQSLGADLETIGVITANGHEENIARVIEQWKPLGVTLRHEIAQSDKETIAIFQQMLPEIDGYWLLPDNRVLSRQALRDMMGMARRAGVGILVHDEQLLEYGSLISVKSDPREIAEVAYDQLLIAREIGSFPTDGMHPLYRSRVRIHADSAQLLGLSLDGVPNERIAR